MPPGACLRALRQAPFIPTPSWDGEPPRPSAGPLSRPFYSPEQEVVRGKKMREGRKNSGVKGLSLRVRTPQPLVTLALTLTLLLAARSPLAPARPSFFLRVTCWINKCVLGGFEALHSSFAFGIALTDCQVG